MNTAPHQWSFSLPSVLGESHVFACMEGFCLNVTDKRIKSRRHSFGQKEKVLCALLLLEKEKKL